MLERSATWDRTVKYPHQMAIAIDILQAGQVVHTFTPPANDSMIEEGQATFDRADKVRGKGTITFVDGDGSLTPTDATDLLAPFGTEWRPWRGVRYPDGSTELKSCGIFRIQNPQISDTGDGVKIRIEGKDRADEMSLAGFSTNYVVPAGTISSDAVEDIVRTTISNISFKMSVDYIQLPQLLFKQGSDPWTAILTIAESCGCEVFFDRDGNMVMQRVPTYSKDDVLWTFDEELQGDMTMLNMQRDMKGSTKDDGPWNHIIVQGESVDQTDPVSSEALDNNPNSPTFVGTYGRVTKVVTSKLVGSQEQADAMAIGELNKSLGRTELWTFNHIPNPALEVGDVFMVNRALSKLDHAVGVLDVTSIPLIPSRGQESLSRSRPV